MNGSRLLYASPNGDRWLLVREEADRVFVRHEPNLSSGGRASESDIGAFLAHGGRGPEHQELLRLIGTLGKPNTALRPGEGCPTPAYMVIQIKLNRREGWSAYREAVEPLAERFGGHYLVAGGAKVEVLEGAHDGRSFVLFEFPSMEAIRSFWDSPEYAEAKKLREGLAELDVWAVPGV